MLERLLEADPAGRRLASLRRCGFAAFKAPERRDLVDAYDRFGTRLHGLYGMSECHALYAMQPPRLDSTERRKGGGRPLSPRAAVRVRETGIAGWPRQIVHSDYHPGNVIFTDKGVRAVVDFDSARVGPRAIDVANGALQFSVTRTGLDPMAWPVELDMKRLQAFLGAYDAVEGCILSRAECRALPWLMIEALITEATLPIAATGRFGQIEGSTFLRMVERKATWIAEAAEELIRL